MSRVCFSLLPIDIDEMSDVYNDNSNFIEKIQIRALRKTIKKYFLRFVILLHWIRDYLT